MVREYKNHGDEHFNSYMATQVEPELEKIKGLLRTTHQNLLSHRDPIQALSDKFVEIYKKELNVEWKITADQQNPYIK